MIEDIKQIERFSVWNTIDSNNLFEKDNTGDYVRYNDVEELINFKNNIIKKLENEIDNLKCKIQINEKIFEEEV